MRYQNEVHSYNYQQISREQLSSEEKESSQKLNECDVEVKKVGTKENSIVLDGKLEYAF